MFNGVLALTCALAPKTEVEKRAHSAPTPASLSPVELISRTASDILRRNPRLAPASIVSTGRKRRESPDFVGVGEG